MNEMVKYLMSRGIQALKSIRHCSWRLGELNTFTVPSKKVAYTNWPSEENVAWVMSGVKFGVNHWKCESEKYLL